MQNKTPLNLSAEDYFDDAVEMRYTHYQSAESLESRPHIQDFFCIFLVVKGRIRHKVNGRVLVHGDGELCLIRPGDVHSFQALKKVESEAININISAHAVKDLFYYLGKGFNSENLLNTELPPVVQLAEPVKIRIRERFQQLNMLPKNRPDVVRSALRILLFELIAEYLSFSESISDLDVPDWLDQLCREIQKPENFAIGMDQMKELSGVTHEHLSRSFKKYLGTTPTRYVNNLRLAYAANLLVHTDLNVTDISMKTGFGSLSYFHNIFRKKFGATPLEHRKNKQVTRPELVEISK